MTGTEPRNGDIPDPDADTPLERAIATAGSFDTRTLLVGLLIGWIALGVANASWLWAAAGAGAWIAANILKLPAVWIAKSELPAPLTTSASGLVSGAAEIATACLLVDLWLGYDWRAIDVVALGFGAATLETLLLLAEGVSGETDERHLKDWEAGARHSRLVRHALLVERGVTIVLHVGCRTLAIALLSAGEWPALIVPVLVFALADGLADYGEKSGWNWYTGRTHLRYFGGMLVLSLICLVAGLTL